MRRLTPRGPGAVAVVAVGRGELGRLEGLLRDASGAPLDPAALVRPTLARVRAGASDLDEVLVVPRRAAGGIELHFHGSELILEGFARTVGGLGEERPDPPARLLREALSEAQLALALEQLGADLETCLTAWEGLPEPRRRTLAGEALARAGPAMALAGPHKVVLVGRQNAGKSTLMNRLLLRERVLAGSRPGLTRDPVREVTALEGYPFHIVDTAGEGPGEGVDAAALDRGRSERGGARCLLCIDGEVGPTAIDRGLLGPDVLVVRTKGDRPPAPWPADVPCHLTVTCLDPAEAPGVRHAVGELLRRSRGLPAAGPVGGPAPLDRDQLRRLRCLAGR